MNVVEQARKIRNAIDIASAEATDATASKAVDIYPMLKQDGSLVKAGTRIKWNGQIKKRRLTFGIVRKTIQTTLLRFGQT